MKKKIYCATYTNKKTGHNSISKYIKASSWHLAYKIALQFTTKRLK